jgi:hypothetical protein
VGHTRRGYLTSLLRKFRQVLTPQGGVVTGDIPTTYRQVTSAFGGQHLAEHWISGLVGQPQDVCRPQVAHSCPTFEGQ